MIEVRDLVKAYGLRQRTVAVDRVSFSVKKATVHGLLGSPGSGKTTILRILATALRPTSGTVEIDGEDVLSNPRKVREVMAFAPDRAEFTDWRSGQNFLRFWGKVSGLPGAARKKRIREIASFLGLEAQIHERPERQLAEVGKKLLLAQALLTNPTVGIFDEPLRGSGHSARAFLVGKLRALRKGGMTIVMSSQFLSEIRPTCDTVTVLSEGRATEAQEVSTLLRRIGQGRHARIFVESDDISSKAIRALRDLKGVVEVRTTPAATVVYVEPGTTDIDSVRETLEREGVSVRGLREAEITLGDVFRALEPGETG